MGELLVVVCFVACLMSVYAITFDDNLITYGDSAPSGNCHGGKEE